MEPDLGVEIYEFYSDRCEACQNQQNILDNSDYYRGGSFSIIKIDVDSEQELAQSYNIKSLPTFLAIRSDGVEVDRITGTIGTEALHDWAIEYL